VLAPVVLGGAVLIGAPASAASSGALTPLLNCVTVDPQSGDVTAYFGYSNTLGAGQVVAVGDNNQLFPVDAFQGQPTVFNEGTYPQVFAVTYDPTIFPSIFWILNGQEATADDSSPTCVSGVTSPATDVTAGAAVLTGVVVPAGPGATYSFEYGTTTALGASTASQSFSGTQPGLVQTPVTGLIPGTTYYVRIDTQTGSITTQGQTLSFTTPAAAPLAITTARLPSAISGSPYDAQLAGTGGVGPYVWSIAAGALPPGLTLNSSSGVISGTPSFSHAYQLTVMLSDSSLPAAEPATRTLSLAVLPAAARVLTPR
jgi:hypothetical protein